MKYGTEQDYVTLEVDKLFYIVDAYRNGERIYHEYFTNESVANLTYTIYSNEIDRRAKLKEIEERVDRLYEMVKEQEKE